MKIRTNYDPPPIPVRHFDWSAIDEDSYDGAPDASARCRCQGFGATEDAAIADLQQQLDDCDGANLPAADAD